MNASHNTKERESLNVANCLCCTLADKMRDCPKCAFNAGLVFKALQTIKQVESVIVPAELRDNFVQQVKTLI